MEASKKLVAVFLICIVMFSSSVHGESNAEKIKEAFKTVANEYTVCYNDCHKECSDAGFGYTHCEMKCDEDCTAKLIKERIEKMKN
ncbi:major pollen allergen Ole e 6-like [Lycium barbarum]|uniref:major pollen allergen Ole e 6-like n=1 Tax=Lycium ferocissimum TaxID=112874 RepID=UPI00281570C5|nr:major pollen allergen Ole e 6-like [Lycium ferocissimum]XP_060189591.1 major pollen allergen Ole e 6-like [Lycium barbarum]